MMEQMQLILIKHEFQHGNPKCETRRLVTTGRKLLVIKFFLKEEDYTMVQLSLTSNQ